MNTPILNDNQKVVSSTSHTSINDGGPAFPHGAIEDPDAEGCFSGGHPGMTLRDYFAAKALECVIGLMSDNDLAAMEAYKIADAMIYARSA